MSEKPSKPPAGKPDENEKVVPLRKKGLLSPESKGSVYCGFGIEDGDLVFRNPDGSIERHKLTDDDT